MAEKLLEFYKLVNERLGMKGKMDFAIETKMPSTKASIEPDSPQNIELFRKAYEKISGEKCPL